MAVTMTRTHGFHEDKAEFRESFREVRGGHTVVIACRREQVATRPVGSSRESTESGAYPSRLARALFVTLRPGETAFLAPDGVRAEAARGPGFRTP